MSLLEQESYKNIMEFSAEEDAVELSKCNKILRENYEQQRNITAYEIIISEGVNEKINIEIKNYPLYWKRSEKFELRLKKLSKFIHQVWPTRLIIKLSIESALKVLRKLRLDWLEPIETIHIECITGHRSAKNHSEVRSEVKERVFKILEGFDIINNIMFTKDFIWSQRYDVHHMACCFLRRSKFQKRELKLSYEHLDVNIQDVQSFLELKTGNNDVHIYYPISSEWDRAFAAEVFALAFQYEHDGNSFRIDDIQYIIIQNCPQEQLSSKLKTSSKDQYWEQCL